MRTFVALVCAAAAVFASADSCRQTDPCAGPKQTYNYRLSEYRSHPTDENARALYSADQAVKACEARQ